jgi:pimeloyl-ACP methyl ester carboxylesterase
MLRFLRRLVVIMVVFTILALIGLRLAAWIRESASAEDLAPDTGRFIETATGQIFTQSAGPQDAQPILLAHGTAAWSGFWAKEVALLGATGAYRATAFDMPPFGLSDRPKTPDYSRTTQATRILASFAGLVIIDGALALTENPEAEQLPLPLRPMPLRKTLVAASVTNPWATRVLLRGLIHQKDAATDHYIDVLQHPQRRIGTTGATADWLPALLAPETDSLSRDPAAYANLPIPVRIIWGDQDTVTPPAQAEALAAALGQGDVRYLKDVGHIPHIEAPEAFADLLLKLLAEIKNDS